MKITKKKVFMILINIIILTIFFSCSFIDDNKEVIEPISHPDLSLYNTSYKLGRENGNPLIINADLLELFEDTNKAQGKVISFYRYDNKGQLELKGTCDFINIDTKNENALLKGNVSLNIISEGLFIKSKQVSWNNKNSILDTDDNSVEINWNKENKIIGKGFTANLNTKIFELSTIENGIINEEN